ncbi:RecB family exonuclease [Nocardioides sp. B-3]|uniref:RecB family exonuclease n=1 Tax=Nocardioides sp. B-3 TaxID=2895565 RepID=UPI00215280FB|nr:PD-(D/E)XK nuclease family protein [Nocardioides sp. B-3]
MFGGEGPDVATWLTSCREVLSRYFTLEDPRRLEPAEREVYVEALLDSKLLLRGFVDRVDVAADGRIRVVDYKGLALETPLPTPTGWTSMADVAVGEQVPGANGLPVTVVAKSGVHHRPCYRVTFLDGSSVVSDNVHLWRVVTNYRQTHTVQTVDTHRLHELVRQHQRDNRPKSVWINSASELNLPDMDDLPVSPWLLGARLGDGDTRAGALTVGQLDHDDMLTLAKEYWPRKISTSREKTAWRFALSKLDDRCTFGHSDFRPATPRAHHATVRRGRSRTST